MDKVAEELKKGLKLLKQEWQEDLAQYKRKFLHTSLPEKKREGITWHPIQVKRIKIGSGERLVVEIEKQDIHQPSAFKSGKSVQFFSTAEGQDQAEKRITAVINQVSRDSMTVTLQGEELPDWMEGGRLGVDLLFDEASYREMASALKQVLESDHGRIRELKEILLGDRAASFGQASISEKKGLNFSQNQACQKISEARDVAIIHGPPGTGKTTTLIQAISTCVFQKMSVLVCAPSNAAVDLLVEKLADQQITTLRLGHPARVEDKILNLTLDTKTVNHPSYKDLKKLRKEIDQYLKLARQYKRNFGPEERKQRKRLLDEVGRIREAARQLEEYIAYDIFQKTQVFATTLVGAASHHLKDMRFDVVFMDEAAQGLEAASWIPILKAGKVVFAGDHLQLPPTIKSLEAAKNGLAQTLMEKVIHRKPETATLLRVQYRMNADIMGFSNDYFYGGKLQAADITQAHLFENEPSLEWIDTAGAGFTDRLEAQSLSTYNPEEASFVVAYLHELIQRIGVDNFLKERWTIGVIAPYAAQVRRLRQMLAGDDYGSLLALSDLISIDTVDGFQGQERDLILISMTRSNERGEIGFLADKRRINVALTRAKRKLVLVGDGSTLAAHPFFDALLAYFEKKGGHRSVWEFL